MNAYIPGALMVAEAVLHAMRSLVPDKTSAEGSGSGTIALGGRARDGKRSYVQYEIIEDWRTDYNARRPHTSLEGLTPMEFATRSGVGDKDVLLTYE